MSWLLGKIDHVLRFDPVVGGLRKQLERRQNASRLVQHISQLISQERVRCLVSILLIFLIIKHSTNPHYQNVSCLIHRYKNSDKALQIKLKCCMFTAPSFMQETKTRQMDFFYSVVLLIGNHSAIQHSVKDTVGEMSIC